MTNSEKIKYFISSLLGKYIVWIIFVVVIIGWIFFPALIQELGDILLFWAPIIIIIFSLLITLTFNSFKFKKDQEQGIYQYDISITKFEFNLIDIIIYCGTLAIIFSAEIFNKNGINFTDLIQALIFFGLAYALRQIFYKKIIK